MDGALLQALSKELVTDVTNFEISRYLSIAGFVVLLYDHLLTLSDEMGLVWRNPSKPVAILFLFNRYYAPLIIAIDMYVISGFARNIPDSFCRHWVYIEGLSQTVCFGVTHALVTLRVRALYSLNPVLDRVLLIAGALYFTTTVGLSIWTEIAAEPEYTWNSELNMCIVPSVPSFAFWIWVPALVYEFFLFCLTAVKAVEHWQRNVTMPVTRLLYRDGFMYFLVIAVCSAFNIVVWAALPSSFIALAKYFTFSFVTAMSSRLILNLRSLRQDKDGRWNNVSTAQLELTEFPGSPANYSPPSPWTARNPRNPRIGHSPRSSVPVSHLSFTLGPPPIPKRSPSRALTLNRSTSGSNHQEKSQSDYGDPPDTPDTSNLFMPPLKRLEVRVNVDVEVEGDDGDTSSWHSARAV